MKSHRRNFLIFIIIVIMLTGGYFWFSCDHEQELKKDNAQPQLATMDNGSVEDPVATVQTVPIKKTTITENITVYGTVIPAPGAVQAISVPFESRIRRILVSSGQRVSEGEILLEIEPSRDTRLQVEEARNAAESAKRALKHMQERFDLKLSTNQELLQAKQAFEEAQLRLESLEQRGAGQNQQIRATSRGVVNKVSVQEGSIVSAGSALLEIVPQNRFEVRFGVEPEDMKYLRVDQPVSLSSVNTPKSSSVTGRTRTISQSINPATRLIDVFIELPPSSNQFLLDEYVRGTIEIASKAGLVVPRSAVLPEEDEYVLFTVKDGKAKKHTLQIGLENRKEVEIIGNDLHPGELVVTLGNYELQDGMAVKMRNTQ
jgi:membrane fusion protein (multidrug efflux system)